MTIYPNSFEPARCRGCGLEILWALTHPNQRKTPLDRPVSYTLTGTDADGHQLAEVTSSSHFDTCRKADKFRKAEPAPTPKEQLSLFK